MGPHEIEDATHEFDLASRRVMVIQTT